jgi:sugar-specific transcriptional regulator TrmB
MVQLKQLLLKLNLNEKETVLFLTLVKLGKAGVSAIARESSITRTHIYDIVQNLVEKGLVSEVEERGIKTYEAVGHAGLLAFVSREQKQLQNIEKKIAEAASEFNALQVGTQQKTKVRFFDGVEGIKSIYQEVERDVEASTEKKEVLTIFSPQNLESIIPNFSYFAFANTVVRDIVCEDKLLDVYKKQIVKSAFEVQYKIWPKEQGIFPTDSIVWKNKIAYTDLVGYPSGIIIENEAMTKSFIMWFNMLWKNLE